MLPSIYLPYEIPVFSVVRIRLFVLAPLQRGFRPPSWGLPSMPNMSLKELAQEKQTDLVWGGIKSSCALFSFQFNTCKQQLGLAGATNVHMLACIE